MKKILLSYSADLGNKYISELILLYKELSCMYDVKIILFGFKQEHTPLLKDFIFIYNKGDKNYFLSEGNKEDLKQVVKDFQVDIYLPYMSFFFQHSDFLASLLRSYNKKCIIYYLLFEDIYIDNEVYSSANVMKVKEKILEYFGYPFEFLLSKYYFNTVEYFIDVFSKYDIFKKFIGNNTFIDDIFYYLLIEYYINNDKIGDGGIIFSSIEERCRIDNLNKQEKLMYIGYIYPKIDYDIKKKEDYIYFGLTSQCCTIESYIFFLDLVSSRNGLNIKCIFPIFSIKDMEYLYKKYNNDCIEFLPFWEKSYNIYAYSLAAVMPLGNEAILGVSLHNTPTLMIGNKKLVDKYKMLINKENNYNILIYNKQLSSQVILSFLLNMKKKRAKKVQYTLGLSRFLYFIDNL